MGRCKGARPGRPKKRTKRAKVIAKWISKKEKQKREALEERSPPREPLVTVDGYDQYDVTELPNTAYSPQPGPSGLQFRDDATPTLKTYRASKNRRGRGCVHVTPERSLCKTPRRRDIRVPEDVLRLDSDEELPPLTIEPTSTPKDPAVSGRRVVDILHVTNALLKLGDHSRLCTTGKYELVGEVKPNGLLSTLKFHCSNCDRYSYVDTGGDTGNEVNQQLVWGATAIGSGHSQMQELFSILDIPFMAENTYRNNENKVFEIWEQHLLEKMASAGKLEKEIAIAHGHVENGVVWIKVIGDGGWCKRTYGHSFDASAGVACIIGAETKLLLFVGIRNKYCYICAKHKNNSTTGNPPEHKCFKNYTGPSTGMETDIIIEGFNQSEKQHGVQYRYYIGDGDSSVYPRIKKSVSYGRSVVKIECANHVVRCYTSKLHVLKKNMKFDSTVRKLLVNRLPRLTTAARGAIRQCGDHQDVKMLQEDLKNGPRHVFGDHSKCRALSSDNEEGSTPYGFCKRKPDEKNYVPMLEECDMLTDILGHLEYVVRKADTLRYNMTNNQAERFNSMVAKLISGKRVDHTKRGGYRGRIFGAGLAHSSGPSWHLSPLKRLTGRSPGYNTKKEFLRRKTKSAAASRRRLEAGPTYKKKTSFGSDKEYGPLAAQEDLPEEVLERKTNDFLEKQKSVVDCLEKQHEIQEKTKGQSECALWRELRQDRLTASNFGSVVQRRLTTSCHKMVERLLYNTYDLSKNKHIMFGRHHEQVAIQKYETETGQTVLPCGLFIDFDYPFLGASPDGLIGDDGIVEVKTVPSIGDMTIAEALDKKCNLCIEKSKDGVRLKRKHKYFFQVQGQLSITRRKYCDFIVYAKNAFSIERIYSDPVLWEKTMLPKLTDFYMQCILPEIVDPRIPRGLEVREPLTLQQARVEQGEKKKLAVEMKVKKAEAKFKQHQQSPKRKRQRKNKTTYDDK